VRRSVSMADDTFAADTGPRATRAVQRFGRIIVVGGGCYGSYYVRQLARARSAGAIEWSRLIVVDRDPRCAVAALDDAERPAALEVVTAEWREYFASVLGEAHRTDTSDDAIVPSPLMPHLMADWLIDRARQRWPARTIDVLPLDAQLPVRWQRTGDDGTHYVSFAEWMCPINCIEPARCPHTRAERTWSMPIAVGVYADRERGAGRPVDGALVFHCAHRAYGVGMIDVAAVLAADRAIAERASHGQASFLVGTASHCHGALRRLVVGP
jgi:hypothetical protein